MCGRDGLGAESNGRGLVFVGARDGHIESTQKRGLAMLAHLRGSWSCNGACAINTSFAADKTYMFAGGKLRYGQARYEDQAGRRDPLHPIGRRKLLWKILQENAT